MRSLLQRYLLLLAAAALVAAPAAADWLVTRDGGKIETKGPWKVDGRRVIFTAPNGTLSALRADDVDLERSAAETEQAKVAAVAPPPEPEKREPVLRLTEKDLPPVQLAPEANGEGNAAANAETSPLEVVSWERTENPGGEGIEIFGTIRNSGVKAVTSPTMILTIYDEDGGLLATAEGTINAGAIPVGRTANFRAAFPGVVDFTDVRFDVRGNIYATAPRTTGAEDEEGVPLDEPVAPFEDEGVPLDEGLAPEDGAPPS